MDNMFKNCASLKSINIRNFKTYSAVNMAEMFYGCINLEYIELNNNYFISDGVTSLEKMFYNCTSLISLDLSNFNGILAFSTESMFENCEKLENINIYDFIGSKVTNMNSMFKGCKSLPVINLGNMVGNVKYMDSVFADCINVEYINLAKLNTTNVISKENLFSNCPSLKSIDFNDFSNSETINNDKLNKYNMKGEDNMNDIKFSDSNGNLMPREDTRNLFSESNSIKSISKNRK